MTAIDFKDAVGIGIAFISEEHINTFLLSSAFTGRTIVHEKGEVEAVKTDLKISLALNIAIALALGLIFESWLTALVGTVFALTLYYIYYQRAELGNA